MGTAAQKKDWTEIPFGAAQAGGRKAGDPPAVFVALPTYDGWIKAQALVGLMLASSHARTRIELGFGSLLACNFNGLLCKALNTRNQVPWSHFAMHHADIAAPAGWLDTLLDEQQRVGADILSCAVLIKDDRRLTSTGVVQKDGSIRRLTVKEVYRLPETFSAADLPAIGIQADLVVNTGLWICDFTQPWVEDVCFNIGDAIRKNPDGTFRALITPEDWQFSHWANRRGLRVFCTRKVKPVHFGEAEFRMEPSEAGWDVDLGDDYRGDVYERAAE